MAAVYRATDDATGTTVAVKVLTATDGEAVVRFEREAELQLGSVAGPQVVRAYKLLTDPQRALVLEFMNAGSLRDYFTETPTRPRPKPWTDREIASVVRAVAHGVAGWQGGSLYRVDLR